MKKKFVATNVEKMWAEKKLLLNFFFFAMCLSYYVRYHLKVFFGQHNLSIYHNELSHNSADYLSPLMFSYF